MNEDEHETCPICYQEMRHRATWSCLHRVCHGCASEILRRDPRCPFCRRITRRESISWPFLAIISHSGRGNNIRYRVLWADRTITSEPASHFKRESLDYYYSTISHLDAELWRRWWCILNTNSINIHWNWDKFCLTNIVNLIKCSTNFNSTQNQSFEISTRETTPH